MDSEREAKSTEVRNRDIPMLAGIIATMQEVRRLEERREWERERMYSISQHLTGMPGGGAPKGLDAAFSAMSETEERHKRKCMEYARQMREAEKMINSMESRTMRAFVTLKYLLDAPDAEIRRELNMTRTGFARARRAVENAKCMADVRWRERYILTDC